MKTKILFCLFFCFYSLGYAQRNYTSLGIGLETMYLLKPDRPLKGLPLGASVSYTEKISSFWNVGLAVSYTNFSLEAPAPYPYTFKNNIWKITLYNEFTLPDDSKYYKRNILRPFIRLGVGGLHHNPYLKVNQNWERLDSRACGCQSYKRVGWELQGGIGSYIRINDRIDIQISSLIHKVYAENMSIPMQPKIVVQKQKNDIFIGFQIKGIFIIDDAVQIFHILNPHY